MIPTGSSLTETATNHGKMEERRDRTVQAQGLPSHSNPSHTGMNVNININDEMHEILPDDMDFLSFFSPSFNDFNDNDDNTDKNSTDNNNTITTTTTTTSNSIQDRFPLSFLPNNESASTLKKNDASTLSVTTEDPVFQSIDPRVSSSVTTPMQSVPTFDDPLYNNFTDIPQVISSSMHDQILDFNDYQTGDLTGIWDFNVDQFQMTPSSSSDIATLSAPNSFIQENPHIYSFLSNSNSNTNTNNNNNNNNGNFLNSFSNGGNYNGNNFGTSLTMDHTLYPHAGFSTTGNFQTSVYQPHSPVTTSVKPISTSNQRSKISKSSQLQAISIPLSSPSTAYSIRKTSLQRQPPTPLGSLNKRSSSSFTSTGLSTSASLSNGNLAGFGGKPQVQCFNCKTFKTPLWRRDPDGNTLCNACGLFQKLHGTMRPLSMKSDVIKKRASRKKKNKNNKTASLSATTVTGSFTPTIGSTTAKKVLPVSIARKSFIPTSLSNSVPTTGMSTATTTAAATSYIDSVNTAKLRSSLASDLTTNGYIASPRDMGGAKGSAAASVLLRTTVSPSLANDFRSETVSKPGTGSPSKAVATGTNRSAMLQHAYREATTAHLSSFPSDSNIAAATATATATAATDPFDSSSLEAPFGTSAASIPTSNPTVTHQSLLSRQLQNPENYNQLYKNQQHSNRMNYPNSAGHYSPATVKKTNKKSEQQHSGVSAQEQLLYIPTDPVNTESHIASNTLGAGVAGSNNMSHEYDWLSFGL